MLIVLPPSETKRPSPEAGPPLDIDALSFPELTPQRRAVIEALIATSAGPDAFARLHLRPSFAADIARNTRLLELPAMPAADLYTGPLHLGLDLGSLQQDARARTGGRVVITSPVWGLVRPDDRIPTYRCDLFVDLVGMGRLDHFWRPAVATALAGAAGAGLVVDLRSPTFQQIGMPAGLGERTVTVRVEQRVPGRRIGDVVAKRVRGEAAHHLLEHDADPDHPAELAEILGDEWPVQLDGPERPGKPWTLTLSVAD